MSIKIFHGFAVQTSSAAELLRLVGAFRPWIEAQGEALFRSFVETSKMAPMEAWMLWQKLRTKAAEKGLRAPAFNTDFELVFFPHEQRFLGIAFTEHVHWHDEWLKQPGVSEYCYWTNTDRPEHVSAQEWAIRGAHWSQVLPAGVPPAMAGFSIQVADPIGPHLPLGG